MSNPVTLATDRLLLRPWLETDREPFAELNADPRVMEFFPSTLTRDESNAFVDRICLGFVERGWGLWAVEVVGGDRRLLDGPKPSNDARQEPAESTVPAQQQTRVEGRSISFIGYVGLSVPRFEAAFTPCVEIGWRLARPAWGYGYATEAARAVCRFAFDQMGLDEVVSFTAEINARSIRVMQRLGMTHNPADDFDHPSLPAGDRLRRHVLYRINRQSSRPDFWSNPPRLSGETNP